MHISFRWFGEPWFRATGVNEAGEVFKGVVSVVATVCSKLWGNSVGFSRMLS